MILEIPPLRISKISDKLLAYTIRFVAEPTIVASLILYVTQGFGHSALFSSSI